MHVGDPSISIRIEAASLSTEGLDHLPRDPADRAG
jgi:hypothetical protein